MTTEVTPGSLQKKVPVRRAQASENFPIASMLPEAPTAPAAPAAPRPPAAAARDMALSQCLPGRTPWRGN